MGKIAIVKIRGNVRARTVIVDTLNMLGLYRTNYCVLIKDTPSMRGMIKKVKDYTTWGEIDAETEKKIMAKAEKTKDKEGKEITKKFIRLDPPRKGYGRNGIKRPFSRGGGLGNRKEKINELLNRMLP